MGSSKAHFKELLKLLKVTKNYAEDLPDFDPVILPNAGLELTI
jgi:hypothetical protein